MSAILTMLVNKILIPLAVTGGGLLLGWLGKKLGNLITSKTDNQNTQNALLTLADMALTIVKSMQQEIVDDLKAAAADGKLTKEEIVEIKDKALVKFKALLKAEGIDGMSKALKIGVDVLEEFLSAKIEAAVHDIKKGNK